MRRVLPWRQAEQKLGGDLNGGIFYGAEQRRECKADPDIFRIRKRKGAGISNNARLLLHNSLWPGGYHRRGGGLCQKRKRKFLGWRFGNGVVIIACRANEPQSLRKTPQFIFRHLPSDSMLVCIDMGDGAAIFDDFKDNACWHSDCYQCCDDIILSI